MAIISLLLKRNLRIKAEFAAKEQYYARTDMLTGIANRRAGVLSLEEAIKNYPKTKPLTVCFIDLNKLKHINDTYGHAEGDFAIITISSICSELLEANHQICRMGGDEFLIMMPNTRADQAQTYINKIHQHLYKVNQGLGKSYKLEISVGIIEYDPESHQGMEHLIEEADQMMYMDKMSNK